MSRIELEPIGVVRSTYTSPQELHHACEQGLYTKHESLVEVFEAYREGLRGLEEFSHAFVLYHLHEAQGRVELTTHPGPTSIIDLPRVGVFASRSQYHPNHLALRLARIVGVTETSVALSGLDAISGSLVLDIKPYVEGFDRPEQFRVAHWYDWLRPHAHSQIHKG